MDEDGRILEVIRKEGTKWCVYSEAGKKLGEYDSKEEADARLKQIEAFKHMKESEEPADADATLPDDASEGEGQPPADGSASEDTAVSSTDQPAAGSADEPPASAPVAEADSDPDEIELRDGVQIIEAVGKSGRQWDVLIIEAGTSKNGYNYRANVLQEAAPLYEGVSVFADHDTDDEQRIRPERSVKDKVGTIRNVAYGTYPVSGRQVEGLKGRLTVVAPWLRETLKEAVDIGEPDFFGLSHNVVADWVPQTVGGQRVMDVQRIRKVRSVDIVTVPSAGGRIGKLVASDNSDAGGIMDPEELQKLIADQVATAVAAAMATKTAAEADKGDADDDDAKEKVAAKTATKTKAADDDDADADDSKRSRKSDDDTDPAVAEALRTTVDALRAVQGELSELRVDKRRAQLSEALHDAQISEPGKEQVRERFEDLITRRDIEDSEIAAAIARVQDYEAKLVQENYNPQTRAAGRMGNADSDQIDLALQGFFARKNVGDVRAFSSLQEAYCKWTHTDSWDFNPLDMVEAFSDFGATRGYDSARHHTRVRESLTTATWAQLFADVFYLSMMRDYAENPYQDWRKVVSSIVPVTDFRTRHWARTGGYGDLTTVSEGATYPVLSTPGDEEVTWTIAKRGGIDDVTMESILGDRVNKVQQLPREMAYASARTLYKFVLNMATTDNPTMDYDSVALYNAAHSNTGTTALTVAGFDAVEVAMRSQTRFGTSDEILGPRNLPKIVIVPNELEARARRIFGPSQAYAYGLASTTDTDTSLDPQQHSSKNVTIIVYDYLTDATDWFAIADPNMVDTIVLGFLNGNENPELFVQDQNNVGSTFTADKISYKVRHVFGGDVGEHRSFYRQVVSG